jgi:hypothetical protein
MLRSIVQTRARRAERTVPMSISRPSSAFPRSIWLIGSFFASEKVKWRSRMGELNVSVSMSSEPAANTYPRRIVNRAIGANNTQARTLPPRASSAHWASASDGACVCACWHAWEETQGRPYDNDWDAHEAEEPATFLIVLLRHFHCPSGQLLNVLRGACASMSSPHKLNEQGIPTGLFGLLALLFGLLSLFKPFRKLGDASLVLRWNTHTQGGARTTPDLRSGGFPSNTYAGLIPFSTMRIVR